MDSSASARVTAATEAKKRWQTPLLTTEPVDEARVASTIGFDLADLS